MYLEPGIFGPLLKRPVLAKVNFYLQGKSLGVADLLLRVFADLQVHSPYSRATSKNMNLKELARFASMKGLNVVGTGDFTHPDWRNEIRRDLLDVEDSGLYSLRDSTLQVRYMLTGEVNTTFQFKERSRRIHHCLLAPSIESAETVSDRLAKYGNLLSDG